MRVVKYKTKLTEDRKVVLEKEVSMNCPDLDKTVRSPNDVARFDREFLQLHKQSEGYLYMICMNTKNEITSIFGVREIFQKALLENAVSIIIMNNHQSGNPKPSVQDIESTK